MYCIQSIKSIKNQSERIYTAPLSCHKWIRGACWAGLGRVFTFDVCSIKQFSFQSTSETTERLSWPTVVRVRQWVPHRWGILVWIKFFFQNVRGMGHMIPHNSVTPTHFWNGYRQVCSQWESNIFLLHRHYQRTGDLLYLKSWVWFITKFHCKFVQKNAKPMLTWLLTSITWRRVCITDWLYRRQHTDALLNTV